VQTSLWRKRSGEEVFEGAGYFCNYGSGTVSKPRVAPPRKIEAAPRVVDIGIGLDARELAAELNGVLA